ncbi:MAG: PAS domain S-box protein [Salinivirgaceae bacterium]|jgi:PAS domain S-box-containing protein|nr:PAS domain S-box protein [Salinivirgaceae bacterium]
MQTNTKLLFEKLQEEGKSFTWSIYVNSMTISFSKGFLVTTGSTKESYSIGKELIEVIHDADIDHLQEIAKQIGKTKSFSIEINLQCTSGICKTAQLEGQRMSESRYEGIGLIKTSHLQNFPLSNERNVSILFDKVPVLICVTDSKAKIQYINTQFEKITGYKKSDLIGINPRILKSGFQAEEFYKDLWTKLLNKEVWEGTMINKKRNGEFYWERATIRPLCDYRGKINGYIKAAEDITQQVETERQLQAERNLFLLGPVMVFKWNPNRDFIVDYASPNVTTVLGYSTSEFVSGSIVFRNLIHSEDYDRICDELEDFLKKPDAKSFKQEYRLKTKSGTFKYFIDYTTLERDENNEVISVNGYLIDNTESKKIEHALRENEIKYRDVFNSAGVGIIYTSKKGEIIDTNKKFEELVNASPNELNGKLAMDLVNERLPKATVKKFLPLLFHSLKGNPIDPLEISLEPLHYEIQSNYNPELESNIGILRDITDKKNAETLLKKSETKYKYLIDNMNDGLIITDKNEKLTFLNKAAKEILEITNANEIESLKELTSQANVDIINQQEKLRQFGEVSSYDISIKNRAGNIKQIEVKASPIYDEQENYNGSFGLIRDITEQYNAEIELIRAYKQLKQINNQLQHHAEELEIAKNQAEEGERLKSAFLANISHEIRTPMNGIVGFAQLCMNPGLTEDKRTTYLDIISNSTLQLERIVMDIIELSKIESGESKPNNKIIPLNKLIEKLYENYVPKAKETNLAFELIVPEPLPHIETDSIKFKKIVSLLLNNAFKFTEKGFVKLETEVTKNHIIISIADSGIGISEEQHEIIFEPFRQVEMAMKRRYGGTGLGLSIAKKLARMLDGDITLESELDNGSTFQFSIPHDL